MNTITPLVSIAMTVFNAEPFVAKSLESLLRQSYKNIEIIISDNGSEDRSGEICQEYAKHDKRITYFRNNTNIGLTRNFVKAFNHCTADYFMFAADHDIYHPDFISTLMKELNSDQSVVLAYPRTILIDINDQPIEMMPDTIDTRGIDLSSRLKKMLWEFSAGNMYYGLYRMSSFKKAWAPYQVIGSDWVLLTKLSIEGAIAQTDIPLFFRRKNRPNENFAEMVNRQIDLFVSNNFESIIPWTMLAYEQIRVITNSALSPELQNQLLDEVIIAYGTRFEQQLREEALNIISKFSLLTEHETNTDILRTVNLLELSKLAKICALFCPDINELQIVIAKGFLSLYSTQTSSRNICTYPELSDEKNYQQLKERKIIREQTMSWAKTADLSTVKLYAGDIPEMSEYDGLIGLSITKSDHRHILHDLNHRFPIPDNSVDSFQAEDVFEHIPYLQLVPIIDDIYRVLKPGALFRLSVPDYGCDVLGNRSIRDSAGNLIFDPGGGGTLKDPGHVWFPTIQNVYNLLEKTLFHKYGTLHFLHYWNMDKCTFVVKPIDYSLGFIKRTPDFDNRVKVPFRPMSLVVDLYKQ